MTSGRTTCLAKTPELVRDINTLDSETGDIATTSGPKPMHPTPHEAPPTPETPAAALPGERLIRLPAVLDLTGRGRTATLDDVKAGSFPKPVKVGAATMWLYSEVQAWIADRVRQSRKA